MGRYRISGVGRSIRRCHRALAAVLSVALVAGMAAQALPVPAYAADGSFTIGALPDGAVNVVDLQEFIDETQWGNRVFSDTIKRQLEEYSQYVKTWEPNFISDLAGMDFNALLYIGQGNSLNITIPAYDVPSGDLQPRDLVWFNKANALAGGLVIGGMIRAGLMEEISEPATPARQIAKKTAVAVFSSIVGYLIGAAFRAKVDGQNVDADTWYASAYTAFINSMSTALFWESTGYTAIYRQTFAKLWRAIPVAIAAVAAATRPPDAQAVWLELRDQLAQNLAAHQDPPTATPPRADPGSLPCDVYQAGGTPCVAAHSTVRALYSEYEGPLYQVQRASDNTTKDIGVLEAGGYADASQQDSFCAGTSCIINQVYDQSPYWNDLGIEGAGSAAGADHGADASALPITAGGHKVYGIYIDRQTGYRDNSTHGIAVKGLPEGMYMVASGTHVNSDCCFDYGNGETNTADNGNGHMDAVNLGTKCYFGPCAGSGPWVEADLENGLFSGGNGSNLANTGIKTNFVTAMLKNDGQTTYALRGGDAQSGGLSTWWNGHLPNDKPGYIPMQQEGAIMLGTGGDNSNWGVGSFFEGVMTQGYPDDAADNLVQTGIVEAGYAGNSGGVAAAPGAAGPAVVHDGYSSVYTVDSANGHLQESFLPKMGDRWSTQDLSAKYNTPPVLSGTQPVSIVHSGYTSVYTVDAANGDLQETYLPRMGDGWSTQDLSANYHTPPTSWTPTAVLHDGYTSVYTVDARNGDLQETYLPKMGDGWSTQDLSANYKTPAVQPGTSPVAVVHDGYTSVYTVDANHDLQETYLPKMGDSWSTQDLSANYKTPATTVTPTAVVHDGYTSVYTVDAADSHLQETYLPKMGDRWSTQDLSANYGTPWVTPGTQPVALTHTGYTSVYTVDGLSDHLQETFLPKMGDRWSTQDLSAKYQTPPTTETPVMLLHPDTSGALTWTSAYTVGEFDNHLQETYLPAIGDSWSTQDLSAKYNTPAVAVEQSSAASWSVTHDGYSSVYTAATGTYHLWETYLPAMGKSWATQDLSAQFHTPQILAQTNPVALTHDGYTSVYTIDASNGHLQETYLPAMGQPWATQDLSAQFHTPASTRTPTAVFHSGYTSVYTVDAGTGHLWETYLPALGGPWHAQDLTANSGGQPVMAYTSPVAIVHSGWTSVYTVDAGTGDLRETYLPALGGPWSSQDLSANFHTPTTTMTPAVVVHSGYTSVYTVDANQDLQETYLPAIGDPWTTQDLTVNYGAPRSTTPKLTGPVALYHTGYTSVYVLDASTGNVDEAYLPAIGARWASQDISAKYKTPRPAKAPSPLLHYDASGALTWTSLYSVNTADQHLQETYLPAIGQSWSTQDMHNNYGTPLVAY